MTLGGKPKSGASHQPWKSLRDSHIPTARRLLYFLKTFYPKGAFLRHRSGYRFRLILRLEKTLTPANTALHFVWPLKASREICTLLFVTRSTKLLPKRCGTHFSMPQARQVEVQICYEDEQFLMRVRDDGKGIDSAVLSGEGREGHYSCS